MTQMGAFFPYLALKSSLSNRQLHVNSKVIPVEVFFFKENFQRYFFEIKVGCLVQIHTGFPFSKASCTECSASAIAEPSFTDLALNFLIAVCDSSAAAF